ncbi:MAG: nucleotidyltransferase family protein [Chloroflexota bacterium]|nr:nucleotidyltransferase family protein [Chloroflexota bacterium]
MRIEKLDSYERVPILDTTRTLLCDFAAGDLKRPLHRLDANWEQVFQGVCRNGLVGLTHRYLQHWEPQDYPPPEYRQWVKQAYRTSAIRMVLMYRNIGKVVSQLAESGVEYIVVKGPVLAHTAYPNPDLRAFNDLDLVVRERDWSAIHRLLIKMGFKPEKDLPHPPPKLVPQDVPYELKYWHKDMGLLVEVHYDDLLNAGLAARDVEGFWRRTIRVDVEGVPVKSLSLEDQLIHLCAHAHYHGYTRLNWFSDIAFIVRDHATQLNWEQLLDTVWIEEAQVGVYYTLRLLDRLIGVSVPEDVLTALRPDRFRCWFHERYLPEEKVLSLQPMWRPDFSFYFTPFLKRLLPDLLVMGRRPEKLHYLIHLLVPPCDWLMDYYSLAPSTQVWIHYLLHPLKLAYHLAEELLNAIAGKHT